MAFGTDFKRKLKNNQKYVVGTAKASEDNAVGGRERDIRGNGRRWGGQSERVAVDSDGEMSKRVISQNRKTDSGIGGNGRRWGGQSERVGADSDGETYKRVRSQNRKPDSGIRGNKSLQKGIEREVGVVEHLGLGDAVQKRKRTENVRGYGGNGRFRDLRVSDKKLTPFNRKLFQNSGSASSKGRYNAVDLSHRQPINFKRKYSDEDSSMGEESSTRVRHASRDYGRKTDLVRDRKHSRRAEDKIENVEASAGNLRSKVKRIGGRISMKHRGAVRDGLLGQHAEITDHPNETSQLKNIRNQGKPAEKSGKKTTSSKKASKDDSVATDDPPKKKKRVIRIDPHDISNKRIDDSASAHNEKIEEKEIELSMNAQFRAIKPSPSILSFVEDNLLGRRRMNELRNAGYNIKLSAPLDNIPFSTSPERERIEENVFRNKLDFFAAAKVSSSFPPLVLPEIAFAGRSNVGKSSLLNALTRQWGVVRTSDKPGHTQTINFFRLASKLCLVDLPGYGFAYAKEEVKDAWEELVKEYVSTRDGLERVCLLIDTKWGMKPRDHELIDLMERSQTPYQVVLTKTDAVFPMDVARRAMQIQENLKRNKSIVNPVMMVSSKSGAGIRSLRTVVAKLARYIKP